MSLLSRSSSPFQTLFLIGSLLILSLLVATPTPVRAQLATSKTPLAKPNAAAGDRKAGTQLPIPHQSPFMPKFNRCDGEVNSQPILSGKPTFVKSTQNGKRYFAGDKEHPLHVLHLYGSPHDMGLAHGKLMKEEIAQMVDVYENHLEDFIADYVKKVPHSWAKFIIKYGLHVALDLTWEVTRKYTPQRFEDELRGLAEGSGVDYKRLRRLNLLPEMIKAACSIVGASHDATANRGLVTLRALDFDSKAPIKRWPIAAVYHPSEPGSHSFVNLGWAGFIGSLTGVSDAMLSISEKVWLTSADLDTRFGTPWIYVLRDVLQYSHDLDSALNHLINTNRTCSIHIGVGDSHNGGQFRGVEYSYKVLNIYDWTTQDEYVEHPRLSNVVYWDKHKQPSHRPCLGSILSEYHGKLSAESMIRQVAAVHATGDLQAAVTDFSSKQLYVANAAADDSDVRMEAYKRSYVQLDLMSLFNETQSQ